MFKNKLVSLSAALLLTLLFLQNSVSAKDEWTAVRSKNFFLIGNAGEKDIRQTAFKLEQFREVFRRAFSTVNFNSPVPTTVVVFKNDAAHAPYKPVRDDGKISRSIAGNFLPGDEINYITLSAGQDSKEAYETVFHDYVHFLIGNNVGNSNVPPWFNEGLAEYYRILTTGNDQKITLGNLQPQHVALLRQNKLIPPDVFFNTDYFTLRQQNDDGVGLFYAQAWALTHYLMHGNGGARNAQLFKFFDLAASGKTAKVAFSEAFEIDYAAMEKELKRYIEENTYRVSVIALKDKLTFDAEMSVSSFSEADAEAVLGDLLLRVNRFPEAETRLRAALVRNPNSAAALISYSLLKLREKNLTEAKKYSEKAVRSDPENYLAYYNYALVLSREGMTDFGFVSGYEAGEAEKMMSALRKAINLNPNFAPSYNLFAFISAVRNENIDEALEYVKKALQIAPGNQDYLIRSAELYLRKEDFSAARKIAQIVAANASDKEAKLYAQNTLDRINSTQAQLEAIKNHKPRPNAAYVTDKPLSEEELARLRERAELESLNEILRRPKTGEKRTLGFLTKIDCEEKEMFYTFKVDKELLKLSSASFESVMLRAFDGAMAGKQIGCGVLKREGLVVLIYRPTESAKAKSAGELVSIEFVPDNFKFLN